MSLRLVLQSAASGLVWGAGAGFLLEARPASLLAWSFVVGGMVTAAAGTTAVHLPSFLAFALPALAALGVRLVGLPFDAVGPMPLVVGLFALLMTAVARRTHVSLGHSFRLRHENADLVAQLGSARGALWEANQDLENQVRERTAELAAERGRLSQWIRDAPDGLLTVAGDKVLAFNPALVRIVGRSPDELTGMRFSALLSEGDGAPGKLLARCLERGEATLETTLHVDGELRYLDVHATRATEHPEQVEIVVRDVTERRLSELRLHESEDNAHRAARFEAIRRLSGGIAHEFNNILAVMLGTVESALAAEAKAAMREGLDDIQSAVRRAAGVTRQLVAISHRPSGRRERIDLNAFVLGQRAIIERLVGQEVRVEVVLEPGELPIFADESRLEEALFHLVLYLTAAQGADTRSDRIVLRTGEVGADGALLELGYERAPPRALGHALAQGALELSAARALLDREGGVLEPLDVGKQHVRFRLVWPLLVESAETRRDSTAPTASAPLAQASDAVVLVVDDEPALLELVATALRATGFRVLTAANAEAARQVEAATEGPIHVLLCDVVMPGTDGPALASELCAKRPALKVCFMSGYTAAYLAGSLGEWSSTPLLEKPFSLPTLISTTTALASAR